MVDFSNLEEARVWFEKQGQVVATSIAVRRALRSFPFFAPLVNPNSTLSPEDNQYIILISLRCNHVAWSVAKYADQTKVLTASASFAALASSSFASFFAASFSAAADASAASHSAAVVSSIALASPAYASSSAFPFPSATAYSAVHYFALKRDAALVEGGTAPESLAAMMIWLNGDDEVLVGGFPEEMRSVWRSLKSFLLAQNQDWDVWTRWYEARVNGEPSNKDLDLAIATLPNEDWEQGPAHVNKLIKALEDKFAPRANLEAIISAASPSVGLNSLGQLDSIPNPEYDAPRAGKTLPELIVIQRDTLSVLKTLKQAPISVQQMVNNYESELEVRGVKLILGRLENCAYIISRAVADTPAARAWLEAGALAAFEQFTIHHDAIVFAYPKHEQVQKLFDETCINFQSSGLPSIHKEMRKLAETSNQAVKANIVTAGFSGDVVNFGTIINNFSNVHQSAGDAPLKSDEKALWLRTFGWVKKAYEAATTVWKFAQTDEGTALIAILSSLIPHLQALLGF